MRSFLSKKLATVAVGYDIDILSYMRTVSPFISERPTLFCRYGIMFLMIVAHGTDVSGSYGGHTEAIEATQRL